MVPVEDFGLEGSSPEQELVSQRAVDADCVNLGSHKPSLTPAHDVKIAQSTEQKGTGRCDAAHLPLAESNWLSNSSIKDRWNLQAWSADPQTIQQLARAGSVNASTNTAINAYMSIKWFFWVGRLDGK
jgi:hypothetical protein